MNAPNNQDFMLKKKRYIHKVVLKLHNFINTAKAKRKFKLCPVPGCPKASVGYPKLSNHMDYWHNNLTRTERAQYLQVMQFLFRSVINFSMLFVVCKSCAKRNRTKSEITQNFLLKVCELCSKCNNYVFLFILQKSDTIQISRNHI